MKVSIWFQKSSQPIVFRNAQATYAKGDLFCIENGEERVKYPIDHLFCVKESGHTSSQPKDHTVIKQAGLIEKKDKK